MPNPFDDDPGVDAWEIFSLAACQPLQGRPGCHVAPRIPAESVVKALQFHLLPGPDELLLAIVEGSGEASAVRGCALTSQRLCWTDPARDDETPGAPRRSQAIEYAELPRTVRVTGGLSTRLDLGSGRSLTLEGLERQSAEALAGVLSTLGHAARSGDLAGSTHPGDLARARAEVGAVVRQAALLYQVSGEIRSFQADMRTATPRVLVSYVLFALCLLVYLVMVGRGVSWLRPTVLDLVDWGANVGFLVALEGESWRLLTSMFLHGGLFHLAVNLWCLYRAGPLIERLYGNLGFTLLYMGSGLGGAIASTWHHPLIPSVGASGAIFGIIGGLGAFVFIHRHAIPAPALQSVRGGVLTFVVFNLLFGAVVPGIDNAAHLGGLVTGFVAGLLLRRPWPSPAPTSGLGRQLGGGVALTALLILAGNLAVAQVREDPEVAERLRQVQGPPPAIDALQEALDSSLMVRFDRINADLNAYLQRLQEWPDDEPPPLAELEALQKQAEANRDAIAERNAKDPDLLAMLDTFAEAQSDQLLAIQALRAYLDAPEDQTLLDGPQGFFILSRSSQEAVERFHAQQEAYLDKHGLILLDPEEDR
ncbi:hypothetical protein BH23PLA1_BH23PLA1_41080 [soil metagenome]